MDFVNSSRAAENSSRLKWIVAVQNMEKNRIESHGLRRLV